MPTPPIHTMRASALVRQALAIADAAVIADIECGGVHVAPGVYDLSAMFDPREHAPESIDMLRIALSYALQRCLVQQIPGKHGCRMRILHRQLPRC